MVGTSHLAGLFSTGYNLQAGSLQLEALSAHSVKQNQRWPSTVNEVLVTS